MDIKRAEEFAIRAHGNQKYGDAPYEVHLRHAVRVLEEEGYAKDPVLLVATWLHDVVEDTGVAAQTIEREFGPEVCDIVSRVTDEPGNNRAERKAKTYPKIRGHERATIVKLCDRIANVEASIDQPTKRAMYTKEFAEFKKQLYVPGVADNLWKRLERLFTDNPD